MNQKKKMCTCGKTKTPPYCDGSHDHMKAESGQKKMCTCGKTKTPPYCDGSHDHMKAESGQKKICTCGKTKTPPYCDGSHHHKKKNLQELLKVNSNIHEEDGSDFDF